MSDDLSINQDTRDSNAMQSGTSADVITLSPRTVAAIILALMAGAGGGGFLSNLLGPTARTAELERRVTRIEQKLEQSIEVRLLQMDKNLTEVDKTLTRVEQQLIDMRERERQRRR